MAIIKELVDIKSSYSAQVDLRKEFIDRSLKKDRMSQYKPIKSHRRAFEIIAEGAYTKNSKRCFILSGSYGTGKSHLCLMAANYFESQSDTDEMQEFFRNYAESEEEEKEKKAELLKTIRKNRRYLVSICDYGTNEFETYILRAIGEALNREGISENEMDSYYTQAIKKIKEWENSDDNYFYQRLESNLDNRNQPWTVNKLLEELSQYNKDAMELFKDIHRNITTVDFQYDKYDYVEIVNQMSQSKVIKDKFAGMVIIFDEFDYQLKGKRFDLDEFQKFAQMCAASYMNGFPIIFIATTHRSFASYKSIYNSEDFLTVNDRVREIPLETEGIEEIISAIVNPRKNSDLWQQEINSRVSTFNQLSNETDSLKVFNWLSAPKVRKRIIENIFPMHPMATFSLLKLASDVGSNNRSVFTFFADEKNDLGSYDWFVKNHSITNNFGELQFYTVDLMFDYFKDKIDSNNQELRPNVRDYIRNFETSTKELIKHRASKTSMDLESQIYDKILRVMIIFQIVGFSINFNSLRFGLYANTQDKEKELEYSLKVASSNKIIYFNETNHTYEFRRSDALDVSGLIREFKDDEKNVPDDLIKELDQIIKHDDAKKLSRFFKNEYYLVANSYNFSFKEDKRLKRRFTTVKEMESSSFFQKLSQEIKSEDKYKQSFEGIAVYVLCDTEDELKRAKALVKNNSSDRIIIGIPLNETPVFDEIFSLKAAISLDTQDFSSQDIGVLKEYIRSFVNSLNIKFEQYIISKNLIYYGKSGIELTNGSNDNDAAAKLIFEKLYESKRNKLNHQDLNIIHDFKENRNSSLKEAVERLLDFSNPIVFRKDYAADRGDIRYIQNVLLNSGVIKTRETIGDNVICDIELDTAKYARVLPALADMIEELKKFDYPIKPHGFIEDYMSKYGLGYNAAILYFAVIKRYFKDSITIIPDINQVGNLRITSYDNLLDLLYYKKYNNAVMEYKKINEYDAALINSLYDTITRNTLGVSQDITIDMLYEELKGWYKGLTLANKIPKIYKDNKLDKFIEVFNKLDIVNPRDFIIEEVKTIYGYDKQDLILEDEVPSIVNIFRQDMELIETGYFILRDKIVNRIREIFNIEELTYEAVYDSINNWFANLSEVQRNYNNDLQDSNSKPLVMHLGKNVQFEELFMNILPNAYNLGAVIDWTIDKTNSYIEKIRAGKRHIEEKVFSVKPPDYILKGKDKEEIKLTDSKIKVKYRGELDITIIPKEEHEEIYITSNNEDPQNPQSQRQESKTEFIFSTSEDKTIKFTGRDKEGRYSKVIILEAENEDNKFEVRYVPEQKQITIGDSNILKEDPKIQVTLPKDVESLKTCINSIVRRTKDRYKLSDNDIIKSLEELIKELKV